MGKKMAERNQTSNQSIKYHVGCKDSINYLVNSQGDCIDQSMHSIKSQFYC